MTLKRVEAKEKRSERQHHSKLFYMYIREIPAEHLPEVREIIERNKSSMLMPYSDLERMFYFYYRFIKVFQRGENVEKRMKKDLGCASCKGKVIMYFRNLEL